MRRIDQRGITDVLSIYSQSVHASAFVFFPRSLTRAMKYSADGSRGREEWRLSNLHLVLFCPSRPRSPLEECDINLEWAPRGSFRYEVSPRSPLPPPMMKKKKSTNIYLGNSGQARRHFTACSTENMGQPGEGNCFKALNKF